MQPQAAASGEGAPSSNEPVRPDFTSEFATADIFDASPERVRQVDAPLIHFGGRRRFAGECAVLHPDGSASAIAQTVKSPGEGRVLVIDGRELPDLACLGEIMAGHLQASGWAGAIVFGAIRDTRQIGGLDVGVMALRTTAKRPFGSGDGSRGVPFSAGGVTFTDGLPVYVDEDAVVVVPSDGDQ